MGDFRKKYPADWFRGGKACKDITGKNNILYWKKYRSCLLCFKIENTPIKDTNGKRKFKRMLIFLSVDKREPFAMKLSFDKLNLVFFTADQSAWLVSSQPHSVYSMVKESTFLKGNFCVYKGFMDVFYIFTSASFLHRLSLFNLRERIHQLIYDPVIVTRITF